MNKLTTSKPLKTLFISASISDTVANDFDNQDILILLTRLVRELAAEKIRICFGGHPTITSLIHHILAQEPESPRALMFQLEHFRERGALLDEVADESVFEVRWVASDKAKSERMADLLGEMRDAMARASDAALFFGGKTKDFKGSKPGILDEFERFRKIKPKGPCYLLGMLGGATQQIIDRLEATNEQVPNGLNASQTQALFHERNIDLAIALILGDLLNEAL